MNRRTEYDSVAFAPVDWPYHVWYQLVRRGIAQEAEVPASSPSRRAWITIRPLEDDQFGVSQFEIEADRYEECIESWNFDQLILNRTHVLLRGVDAVRAEICARGVDLATFKALGTGTNPI